MIDGLHRLPPSVSQPTFLRWNTSPSDAALARLKWLPIPHTTPRTLGTGKLFPTSLLEEGGVPHATQRWHQAPDLGDRGRACPRAGWVPRREPSRHAHPHAAARRDAAYERDPGVRRHVRARGSGGGKTTVRAGRHGRREHPQRPGYAYLRPRPALRLR